MKLNLKFTIIAGLAAVIVTGASLTTLSSAPQSPQYINLKVLPKNISSHDLQSIMVDDFQDGLGVTCGFCHAQNKDGHGLDFVSDAKPEKNISREMMRMTISINKKFFKLKHPLIGSNALIISCSTCHKGQPFPDSDEQK